MYSSTWARMTCVLNLWFSEEICGSVRALMELNSSTLVLFPKNLLKCWVSSHVYRWTWGLTVTCQFSTWALAQYDNTVWLHSNTNICSLSQWEPLWLSVNHFVCRVHLCAEYFSVLSTPLYWVRLCAEYVSVLSTSLCVYARWVHLCVCVWMKGEHCWQASCKMPPLPHQITRISLHFYEPLSHTPPLALTHTHTHTHKHTSASSQIHILLTNVYTSGGYRYFFLI